jgi:hypothetical protein
VRETAACILLWDEPMAAEGPLLRATRDSVPEVVAEAANTLEYYPSQRTLRCLHGLRSHANEQVRREAIESFESIRHDLQRHLRSQDQMVARRVREWLQPVWGCSTSARKSCKPKRNVHLTHRQRAAETLPLAELLELLANPET